MPLHPVLKQALVKAVAPAGYFKTIQPSSKRYASAILVLSACVLVFFGSGCASSDSLQETIVVNSAADQEQPPAGTVTLRAALNQISAGGRIVFNESLDGQTIELKMVGAEHTVLKGEVYAGMTFQGYQERDYGRSALYARKDVMIDASALPNGITLRWAGGESNRARVLAVYGNLTLRNVTVLSGYATAEPLNSLVQAYTLARGGGLAVWGMATLDHCTIGGNTVIGDDASSRDRGAYGGGIYADGLVMNGCVVSGNSASGYGAAGGGIYSVGGSDGSGVDAYLYGCAISGNRVTARHAYGGGVFTLGGGPNNLRSMRLTNCTIARNQVEDNASLAPSSQYYYRGGGIYMGGGYLEIISCSIAENAVSGPEAQFNGKPNVGGGGVAATIGNAHVVEDIRVRHSLIIGNRLNGVGEDLFTGSLRHFYSLGYNRIGRLDVSQILVPVPLWEDLSRKHWPKEGDVENPSLSDLLSTPHLHPFITSRGPDNGDPAVLWYPPAAGAIGQIPVQPYTVAAVRAEYPGYSIFSEAFFRNGLQEKLRSDYGQILTDDFSIDSSVVWHEAAVTWPADPLNAPWIAFWRDLDSRLGAETLDDEFWALSTGGPLEIRLRMENFSVKLTSSDQLGNPRPAAPGLGSIGAIE